MPGLGEVLYWAACWIAVTVAILGLVRDRTDSDLLATLVFVSQALPAFFLSPFAGPVAEDPALLLRSWRETGDPQLAHSAEITLDVR